MAKYTPTPISTTLSNSAATQINDNLNRISTALENTLSRDGSVPNQMESDLDLNNNDVLNVKNLDAESITLNGDLIQPGSVTDGLKISNALSELGPAGLVGAARANLQLGTAALSDVSSFATATQGTRADSSFTLLAIRRSDIPSKTITTTRFRTMDGAPWIAAVDGTGPMAIQDATGQWFQLNFEWSDPINIRWFGAVGDGITDDTLAVKRARDFMQTSVNNRGGILYGPRGIYKMTDELLFTPYAAGLVYNTMLIGDGVECTVFDFSGAGPGKNGIMAVGAGTEFYIRNLSVKSAPAYGVVLKGGNVGTNDFISRCGVQNVRIQACGLDGFYTENSFYLDLDKVWSTLNTGRGFQFIGFHTTVKASNCWAYQNGNSGWRINGVISSTFINCYGEFCLSGFSVTNMRTSKFLSCGAENNVRDGWLFQTATSFTTGLPTESHDILVTMESCFGNQNSTVGANQFSIFMSCLTANSRPINITFCGGNQSSQGTSTSPALVLNAASGAIDIWGYTTTGRAFDSANVNSGGTLH